MMTIGRTGGGRAFPGHFAKEVTGAAKEMLRVQSTREEDHSCKRGRKGGEAGKHE